MHKQFTFFFTRLITTIGRWFDITETFEAASGIPLSFTIFTFLSIFAQTVIFILRIKRKENDREFEVSHR